MVVRAVVGNMATETTDGGRPVETTRDDTLAAFRAREDPAEPLTAKEVADRVDCSRRTALNRLNSLADAGQVASKKVGGRARVWWVPLTDERGAAGRESDATGEADRSPSVGDDGQEDGVTPDEHGADVVAVVDAVADEILPGSGAKLNERRDALLAAVEYLREHGTATPATFRENVYPDHPAHYTAGDDPARSWWKNCVYKGLRAVADRTDAVETADTSGEWRWVGGET